MTKMKIKEKMKKVDPVNEDYDFCGIKIGDMFHNYDFDKTIMIVDDPSTPGNMFVVEFSEPQVVSDDDVDCDIEDCLMRLTAEYGDFYPVSKAKLSFTVGE